MKLKNGLTGVKKYVAMGALAVVGLSSNAMAADPTWLTTLTTELSSIQTMVGTVVGAIVAIAVVPLAWNFVKRVVSRG